MQSPSAEAARGDGQRRPRARRPRARHRDPGRSRTPPRPPAATAPRRPPRSRRSRRATPAPAPTATPEPLAAAPPPAPAPRRPPRAEMKLIERRIGLLFAVFLSLLVIGAGKAAWLGVVKAGHAQAGRRHPAGGRPGRARPPRRDHRPQRHRARRLPAGDDDRRHAVPGQGRRRASPRGSPALLDKPEDEILRQLARRDTGFVYVARHVPAARARKVAGAEGRGARVHPRVPRVYPREWMASQLLGSVGTDNQGLVRPRVLAGQVPQGRRRRAPAQEGRARRGDRADRGQADRARPGPQAHARRQHPGQGRGGARRGRRRSGSPRAPPRSSWTRATAASSRSPTGRA